MATKEIDIIKTQAGRLSNAQKVELIEFLSRGLKNGSRVQDVQTSERSRSGAATKRSVLDILTSRPVRRVFKNAAEVDEYLKTERESWDN